MDYHLAGTPASLVCSSLRSRQPWTSVTTQLLQSDSRKWRESTLQSHDISLVIEQEHTEVFQIYKFIFIAPAHVDTEEPTAIVRVTQLCQDLGDAKAGVIFFLDQENEKEYGDAMKAYMTLQIKLMEHTPNIPIIPLTSLDVLPPTLKNFQDSFSEGVGNRIQQQVEIDVPRDLLGCCSTGEKHLSRQAVDTIVQTQEFLSFRELLDSNRLRSHEGQKSMRVALGLKDGKRFVKFWTG
ncbi:hypothetical protein QBC36DRAFT_174995 [Triangularia setosa]|uniref:Uncharacterized protein n=1 Tax=Triangularia setosa TaxID=2587417 RepID=A0AAN6WHQ7_9PEZI|nr:hypothetical protein QBC36DRAFT_174995 [Podospora setosa]